MDPLLDYDGVILCHLSFCEPVDHAVPMDPLCKNRLNSCLGYSEYLSYLVGHSFDESGGLSQLVNDLRQSREEVAKAKRTCQNQNDVVTMNGR